MNKFAALTLTSLLGACSVVGPGTRGVVTTFGKVDSESLGEGLHFWFPVVHGITKIDTRIQKHEIQTVAGSKDLQDVSMTVALNWSISPEEVSKVYQTLGEEDEVLKRVIEPAVSEILKASTAKKTAEEILTKRHELKEEIDNSLKSRLKGYGVIVSDISIVHVEFTKEFAQAIESKQVAEQRAKQAGYEAQRAEQDAIATVNQAKGQAESQRLLQASMTPAILQKLTIEKWDGKYPQTMVLGAGSTMIKLPELNK